MSTRCQIGFYEAGEKDLTKFKVLIYKHSDGYPKGVLPTLEPFLKDFSARRGLEDTSYAGARCVQALTNACDADMKDVEGLDGAFKYAGFGICQDLGWGIEYFYAVHPNKLEVYEVPDCDKPPTTWKKIKTIKLKEEK